MTIRHTLPPVAHFQPVTVELTRYRDHGPVEGEEILEKLLTLTDNPTDLSAKIDAFVGDLVIEIDICTDGTVHLTAHHITRTEPEHYDSEVLEPGETLLRWSHRANPRTRELIAALNAP